MNNQVKISAEAQEKIRAVYSRLGDAVADFAEVFEQLTLHETWNDDLCQFYEDLYKISDRVTAAKRKLYEMESQIVIVEASK